MVNKDKTQIRTLLKDNDDKLFRIAIVKYDTTEGELLREIVHAWLFANKLKLIENGNKKKRR